jgi:hypothetical protein
MGLVLGVHINIVKCIYWSIVSLDAMPPLEDVILAKGISYYSKLNPLNPGTLNPGLV